MRVSGVREEGLELVYKSWMMLEDAITRRGFDSVDEVMAACNAVIEGVEQFRGDFLAVMEDSGYR